jgi:hypothetical protein
MKRTALFLLAALSTSAFAGVGRHEVEVAIAEAHGAVDAAQRAGAAEHAGNDFNQAQDDIARAERAYEHRDWTHATMEAEKAKADANLAEALARRDRAEATTAEVEATVKRLREEVRMQGGSP